MNKLKDKPIIIFNGVAVAFKSVDYNEDTGQVAVDYEVIPGYNNKPIPEDIDDWIDDAIKDYLDHVVGEATEKYKKEQQ